MNTKSTSRPEKPNRGPDELTPIVKKYSGIILHHHINDIDELTDYLVKKHAGDN